LRWPREAKSNQFILNLKTTKSNQDHVSVSLQRRRSNQEFAPREMGFNGQFAQQQFRATHVGSGSMLLKKYPK
jgi:hypothetical protein